MHQHRKNWSFWSRLNESNRIKLLFQWKLTNPKGNDHQQKSHLCILNRNFPKFSYKMWGKNPNFLRKIFNLIGNDYFSSYRLSFYRCDGENSFTHQLCWNIVYFLPQNMLPTFDWSPNSTICLSKKQMLIFSMTMHPIVRHLYFVRILQSHDELT